MVSAVPEKAESPIDVSPLIWTQQHVTNTYTIINFTHSKKMTEVREAHPENAAGPMVRTVLDDIHTYNLTNGLTRYKWNRMYSSPGDVKSYQFGPRERTNPNGCQSPVNKANTIQMRK